MNRILLPILAIGMLALAFASFITVSLIALAGIGIYGLIRTPSQWMARFSGKNQPGNRAGTAQANDEASGINRIWNDGRGTIIDM